MIAKTTNPAIPGEVLITVPTNIEITAQADHSIGNLANKSSLELEVEIGGDGIYFKGSQSLITRTDEVDETLLPSVVDRAFSSSTSALDLTERSYIEGNLNRRRSVAKRAVVGSTLLTAAATYVLVDTDTTGGDYVSSFAVGLCGLLTLLTLAPDTRASNRQYLSDVVQLHDVASTVRKNYVLRMLANSFSKPTQEVNQSPKTSLVSE